MSIEHLYLKPNFIGFASHTFTNTFSQCILYIYIYLFNSPNQQLYLQSWKSIQ